MALVLSEGAVLPDESRLGIDRLSELLERLYLQVLQFQLVPAFLNEFAQVLLRYFELLRLISDAVLVVEHRDVERVAELLVNAAGLPFLLLDELGVGGVVLRGRVRIGGCLVLRHCR